MKMSLQLNMKKMVMTGRTKTMRLRWSCVEWLTGMSIAETCIGKFSWVALELSTCGRHRFQFLVSTVAILQAVETCISFTSGQGCVIEIPGLDSTTFYLKGHQLVPH